jgi:threonine/homoserine/homoserine lactone efflux protein
LLRWASDAFAKRRGYNEAQRTRVDSVGILIASGLIAGEALTGLLIATFKFFDLNIFQFFKDPSYLIGFAVIVALGVMMIRLPLSKAGRPEDPAPPAAMM